MHFSDQPARNFDSLWASFGTEFGLIPDLALDAVLARYGEGEVQCVPRIVELVCGDELKPSDAAAAVAALEVDVLTSEQRRQVELAFDRWWLSHLRSFEAERTQDTASKYDAEPIVVTETLGTLAGYNAPMNRWLHVWLEHFDGPAAQHFVIAVLRDGSAQSTVWDKKLDEWVQFQAWCRAEPTVMGFTLIGAFHVKPSEVTAVLDVLV